MGVAARPATSEWTCQGKTKGSSPKAFNLDAKDACAAAVRGALATTNSNPLVLRVADLSECDASDNERFIKCAMMGADAMIQTPPARPALKSIASNKQTSSDGATLVLISTDCATASHRLHVGNYGLEADGLQSCLEDVQANTACTETFFFAWSQGWCKCESELSQVDGSQGECTRVASGNYDEYAVVQAETTLTGACTYTRYEINIYDSPPQPDPVFDNYVCWPSYPAVLSGASPYGQGAPCVYPVDDRGRGVSEPINEEQCNGYCTNDANCACASWDTATLTCYLRTGPGGSGACDPADGTASDYYVTNVKDNFPCDPGTLSYEYVEVGVGQCTHPAYLMVGDFPELLDSSDPLFDADPIRECMNRCLNEVGESGPHHTPPTGGEGFAVKDSDTRYAADGMHDDVDGDGYLPSCMCANINNYGPPIRNSQCKANGAAGYTAYNIQKVYPAASGGGGGGGDDECPDCSTHAYNFPAAIMYRYGAFSEEARVAGSAACLYLCTDMPDECKNDDNAALCCGDDTSACPSDCVNYIDCCDNGDDDDDDDDIVVKII